MDLSLSTGYHYAAQRGNGNPAMLQASTVQDSPQPATQGESAQAIDTELCRMIASDSPAALNMLGLDRRDASRQAMVIPYSPANDNHLEGAIGAFMQGDGHSPHDQGMLLSLADGGVVSLHLHREPDGRASFRYYDPGSKAALRDKLKDAVYQLLRRYGIEREWPFSGARPAGKEQADEAGLYAVLAMRDMLAGHAALTATKRDVCAWRERLILTRQTQAHYGDASDAADPFMQAIHRRSAEGSKMAWILAESSPMSIIMEYEAPPRKRMRYQGLSRSFYDSRMPVALWTVKFDYFPEIRKPSMQRSLLKECKPSIEAALRQAGPDVGTLDAAQAFSGVDFGPFKQFLGWLLINAFPQNSRSDSLDNDQYLKKRYVDYRAQKHDPAMREKIKLCYRIGRLDWPYYFTPGNGWQFSVQLMETVHLPGERWISSIDIVKQENLAMVDLFNDVEKLPEELMQKIKAELDNGVTHKIISHEQRQRALASLEPVTVHFARGEMVIDVVVLPKKVEGVEKRFVGVECTPVREGPLMPREIYWHEDLVMAGEDKVRLSDRLKQDISLHFRKMGWEQCLGKSLQPELKQPAHSAIDNDYASLLQQAVQAYETQRSVTFNDNATPQWKRRAMLNMDVLQRQTCHLSRDVIADINPDTFERLISTLLVTTSLVSVSMFTMEMLKAMRTLLRTQAVSSQDIQKYRDMLSTCRNKLATAIRNHEVISKSDAQAYEAINALNVAIEEFCEKRSVQERMLKRRNDLSAAALEANLQQEIQIDTSARRRLIHPSGSESSDSDQPRKRDKKALTKQQGRDTGPR